MVIIGILAIALFEVHLIGGERERQQERERDEKRRNLSFQKRNNNHCFSFFFFFPFPARGEEYLRNNTNITQKSRAPRRFVSISNFITCISFFLTKKRKEKNPPLSLSRLFTFVQLNSQKTQSRLFSSNGRFLLESAPAAPGAGRARR